MAARHRQASRSPPGVRMSFLASATTPLDGEIVADASFWEFWRIWSDAWNGRDLARIRNVLRDYGDRVTPYSRYMERVQSVLLKPSEGNHED